MPPAISDDEASEGNDLAVVTPPKRDKKAVKYTEPKEDEEDEEKMDVVLDGPEETNGDAGDDNEEEGDDEEEGDEEYIVEKILSHMIADDGKPRFEVKWEGFDKKSDRTWEPEDNLQGSADAVLEEYLESIGGYDALFGDQKAAKSKKRGRPSAGAPAAGAKKARKNGFNGDHPLDSEPPESRKSAAWKPPVGSWEDEITNIDMTRAEDGNLVVWLNWKNGEKTQHNAQQAYTRAPQKMLKFYESKINFTSS